MNEWKETTPVQKIKHYINCVHCGKHLSSIDHIMSDLIEITWICEHCGYFTDIKIFPSGKILTRESDKKPRCPSIFILRRSNLLLFVSGNEHRADEHGTSEEYAKYSYENTCPYNIFHSVVNVGLIDDYGEIGFDPHGLFKYLASITYSPDDIQFSADPPSGCGGNIDELIYQWADREDVIGGLKKSLKEEK